MDKKILLSLTFGSLFLLALAVMVPGGKVADKEPKLPWDIVIDTDGNSTVFGLTIGVSTLKEAQEALQEEAKVNLFVSQDEQYSVEAYFRRIVISGFKADLVLSLDIDPTEVKAMYDRGARQKRVETGNKQVDLASEDFALMGSQKIGHITYIPSANLDDALVSTRFGEPSRRVTEKGGIVHWLYPQKGLDIGLNPEGKEVFQYLNPRDFNQALIPLKTQ